MNNFVVSNPADDFLDLRRVLMTYGVHVLLANIAIRARFSVFIPLLPKYS
jgi:hypothetical protein